MSEPADAAPAPAPPAYTEDQTSGRLFVRWNAVCLGLAALALAGGLSVASWRDAAGGAGPGADPLGLAADARWDDGKLEVARYTVRREVDGAPREHEVVRVVATRADAFEVTALHAVPARGPIGRRESLVARVLRADPRRVLSLTASCQQEGGDAFVRLARSGDGTLTRATTSRESAGDRAEPLGAPWLEDQLAFTLRGLDPAAVPLEVQLLPAALLEAGHPNPATLSAATESITVPAGTFDCVAWTVTVGGRALRYWVATTPGRPLVRWDDRTGAGELASIERR